jgi:hypothetical protein
LLGVACSSNPVAFLTYPTNLSFAFGVMRVPWGNANETTLHKLLRTLNVPTLRCLIQSEFSCGKHCMECEKTEIIPPGSRCA